MRLGQRRAASPGGAPAGRANLGRMLAGIWLVSCGLLVIELALTRIFSVTMYYHFAFLAISIALFGLGASAIYVYVARTRWRASPTAALAAHAVVYGATTIVALAFLVRIRVGLTYTPANLVLMLSIYALAALPFLLGGAVISLAMARLPEHVNLIYTADLTGAAAGCVLLIPLINAMGAPGAVLVAAGLAGVAAVLFAPRRRMIVAASGLTIAAPLVAAAVGGLSFDVLDTKGHRGDRVLFHKWNSFSRIAVYDRPHGDWSLSAAYRGPLPQTRMMDIDSAASTPIVGPGRNLDAAQYLRYELTALAYHLKSSGFTALVIGPGGGRDLLSALVFGAARVDGAEINPIIVRDVMLGAFRDFSGGLYARERVRIVVDDGRSFVERATDHYDIIQASLVDTWAATAAGAYTLTENSLYTVEAFETYLDHLADDGVLSITRWVFDGLRLVSLAQEAAARRGWEARDRLAVVQHERIATFLLKRSPFTSGELARLRRVCDELGFQILYAPNPAASVAASATTRPTPGTDGTVSHGPHGAANGADNDYARLILASDRERFYDTYPLDVRPTTDDRPFFFHTAKLKDQPRLAFGRGMLFGNGLSALLTLMGISVLLVGCFIVGPLAVTRRAELGAGWLRWLAYFAALGAGFMLIEVALLQRFVLLLGHPVYSLTVTLFSLLLGGGVGSFASRRIAEERLQARLRLTLVVIVALIGLAIVALPAIVHAAAARPRGVRIALAVAVLGPLGTLMGMPLPSGVRLLRAQRPSIIPWAWGMNGALSVVGSIAAVFLAMNWGFSMTLLAGALCYGVAAATIQGSG